MNIYLILYICHTISLFLRLFPDLCSSSPPRDSDPSHCCITHLLSQLKAARAVVTELEEELVAAVLAMKESGPLVEEGNVNKEVEDPYIPSIESQIWNVIIRGREE